LQLFFGGVIEKLRRERAVVWVVILMGCEGAVTACSGNTK
jgi:hypothetical protein